MVYEYAPNLGHFLCDIHLNYVKYEFSENRGYFLSCKKRLVSAKGQKGTLTCTRQSDPLPEELGHFQSQPKIQRRAVKQREQFKESEYPLHWRLTNSFIPQMLLFWYSTQENNINTAYSQPPQRLCLVA